MENALEFNNKFSGVFEDALLAELETSSILMNVSSGETILKIGKPVMGVPLLISGTLKVSRVNDEGQELLLYYIQSGASCPMSLTCFMTSQLSSVNVLAEEDSSFLVVPANMAEK